MKTAIHAIAATITLLCVGLFWLATLISELFLGQQAIVSVKQGVVVGLFVLIPALVVTAGSGQWLGRARGGRLLEEKRRRMRWIAPVGLLVLLPSALYLRHKAAAGEWDALFYGVQLVELAAGALQFSGLARNFTAGLRLSGRLTRAMTRV